MARRKNNATSPAAALNAPDGSPPPAALAGSAAALVAVVGGPEQAHHPGRRNHGGMPGARFAPYAIVSASGNLVEFPVTVTKACGLPFCFFGGGYLRLAPLPLILRMTRRVLRENRPVIFYVHPREIDVRQPRLAMSPRRRFQTYVNLATTERKLQHLLATFETSSFAEFLGWRAGRSTVTMEAHSPDARTVALAAPATEGATAS